MPVPWLTVLKLVPWTEVIKSAPAVAESARKLWKNGPRPAAPAAPSSEVVVPPDSDPAALPLPALRARVDAAEQALAALQQQWQASAEVAKALAEQNAELVRRVEINRRRVLWLAAVVAVLVVSNGVLFFGGRG